MADAQGLEEDNSWSMKTVIASMKMKWPSVCNMSTVELHKLLEDVCTTAATGEGHSGTIYSNSRHSRSNILILDTRPPEEYEVSHLEGAVQVDPDCNDISQTSQLIQERNPSQVVCYCSLGYRSSKYATHLYKHLKANPLKENPQIYNLEGSIFKWANEGRPMVDRHGVPTRSCHPYNAVWGKILKSDIRTWSAL